MDDGKRPEAVREEASPGLSRPEPPARHPHLGTPPAERPGDPFDLDAESELDEQPAPGSHYEPL